MIPPAPDKQTLTLDGQRIAYSAAGDPAHPPALMVHGWLSHSGIWRTTFEALRETHYCLAHDLLGLADSDKPAYADYTIPAHARRVLAFADALGLDRFTLMGHSMGGQIALYIAAVAAPQRVVRLVDVDGTVTGRLTWQQRLFTEPQVWMGRWIPWMLDLFKPLVDHPIGRGIFRTLFYDMTAIPYADWSVERRMATRRDAALTGYLCGKGLRALDLTPHLSRIQAPTLVIFGREDQVVPLRDGLLVKEHVPGSQIVIIDECGHYPMLEKQAEYVAAVRAFLAE